MQTILVPTDFSENAANAAKYGCGLAKQLGIKRILLYNAFQQPIAADINVGSVELVNFDELSKISIDGLEGAKSQLTGICDEDVTLETLSECALVTQGILDACSKNDISIIVMGVTGGGKLSETLIGSNAVHVSRHAHVPVIIVPHAAKFAPVERIMLACDFKQVEATTPIEPLKKILNATKAKLFVFHVERTEKKYSAETVTESLMLDILLQGYNPEYHFMNDTHFTDAINSFAEQNNIQLIVTIPKKHGLFDSLFNRSHTKSLAFHSHVPMLVMHD